MVRKISVLFFYTSILLIMEGTMQSGLNASGIKVWEKEVHGENHASISCALPILKT